ncbi:hypothetical protein ACFVWG_23940 [Kribbella sp. NPDC058245]|uniref:hypothetical protein n=1 Tax=Kribbella sp. NPDC058245 TaxID=3346399 RepID=UPI0036E75A5F
MTLLDQGQLAHLQGFRDRVLVAAMQAAVAVASEPSSGDSRKDNLRATLATNVLNDPLGHVDRFAWAVVQNTAVNFISADGDIQYTVNSLWDGMAGV